MRLRHELQTEFEGPTFSVNPIDLSVGGAFIDSAALLRGGSTFVLSLNTLEAGSGSHVRGGRGQRLAEGCEYRPP